MLEILILLLLIYNLLIYNAIKNLIIFLSIILLLAIKLFIEKYYFITWIFLIIYASALLILFTYALMIKYKSINYNISSISINYIKEYKTYPYFLYFFILLFIIFIIFVISNKLPQWDIFIYNNIDYKSFYIMKYLLYIEPFFIILLFIELLIAFYILIK